MQRRYFLATSAIALGAVSTSTRAAKPQWPNQPIKWVIPFPAGSSPDLIGRLVAEPLAKALGQAVVVDNKPGAGGNIGTGFVAKAAPDGYTFLFTIQGPLVTAPLLSKSLSYDPARDLAPVSLVAASPNVLVVDPALGVNTVAEFVALAKTKKGSINYGSVGNGSAAHLAMELFKTRAGVDLLHVPYPGFPQVVNALLAGQVQAGFMVPAIAMAQVRAGKLKALGVTTLSRSSTLPEMATLVEQGYPGFEAISWQAVLAPAKTPAPIVQRVASELVRIIKSDEVRSRMLAQYFNAVGTAPDGLASMMKTERERWGQVIAAAGVKAE